MIVMVIRKDLEEGSYELQEYYQCNYTRISQHSRIQPSHMGFSPFGSQTMS
jgi:hypothetical protein